MIQFNEQTKIFTLNTKNTTYAMGVFGDEVLVHLYWGKRLKREVPFDLDGMKRRALSAGDYGEYSTDNLPLEYSSYGSTDMRMPGFGVRYGDGSRIAKLVYVDHQITAGKPKLEGLPATYCEEGDEVETLTIHMRDCLTNLDVYLSYTVFSELDAITRNVKFVNNGNKIVLDTALSVTVDFFGMPDSDLIHLDGTWSRERAVTRHGIVTGNQNVESRVGASSAYHNPFIAVCDRAATENHGNVYGFSLVYSGNFTAGVELSPYRCGRAYIGINPFNFDFILETGESFQTPEAVLVYSDQGLGGMSRIYHRLYRTRLCRGRYRDNSRFIVLNNWETTEFDFNEEKILELAKKGAEIGIDTMVLDDGWFGDRIDETAGLGDWYENPERLPNGLHGLAEKINALGMRFGLWFEPEMVSQDSNLYREHPDWILHTKNRTSTLRRYQYTLDLSRKDVREYIVEAVSRVLSRANIEYVKWDMNRYMTEAGSALLPAERQGEVMHRYMLGLYEVLEELTGRFPHVLFESCASGGGRFDPGMLYYMPQVWTSDDSDAVERLLIQYGTSLVYPYSAMGAHVSVCPNLQVGRVTTFDMRCKVAMPGQFGFELDLDKCTAAELETARQAIIAHRELEMIFHTGDCYRLRSPFASNASVLEFVSEDKNTALLCIYCVKATPNAPNEYILLEGLDEDAIYEIDGDRYGGDYLMNKGLNYQNRRENRCSIQKIVKVSQ